MCSEVAVKSFTHNLICFVFIFMMLLSPLKSFKTFLQRNQKVGQQYMQFLSQLKTPVTERFHIRTFSQLHEQSVLHSGDVELVTESVSSASLRQKLVDFRKEKSANFKKPAYLIFTNKALELMLELRPKSAEELKSLTPKGFKVFEEVYPEILDIISGGDGSSGTVVSSNIADSSSIPSSPTLSRFAKSNSFERDDDSAPSGIPVSSLSVEQQHAAEIVLSGQNVFITGSAGTKSRCRCIV